MVNAPDVPPTVEGIAGQIRALAPQNESQRYLLTHAMEISSELHEARRPDRVALLSTARART